MRVLLLAYPTAVSVAWNFLPQTVWCRFFGMVTWAVNTYGNMHIKKRRLDALRRRYMTRNQDEVGGQGETRDPEQNKSGNNGEESNNNSSDKQREGGAGGDQDSDSNRQGRGSETTLTASTPGRRPSPSPDRSSSSSSYPETDEDETASEGSPMRLVPPTWPRYRPYRRLYRPNRFHRPTWRIGSTDSDTGEDSGSSDAGTGNARAGSLEVYDTPYPWLDNEGASSSDEWGSEIDSDTSSELPTSSPWLSLTNILLTDAFIASTTR
jgi:hypothetical protein